MEDLYLLIILFLIAIIFTIVGLVGKIAYQIGFEDGKKRRNDDR